MRCLAAAAVGGLMWILGLAGPSAHAQDTYAELQQQAAAAYSEQSYALAHEAWSAAARLDVPAADRRTLDFYLADSLWRSRPDAAKVAAAREQLKRLAEGSDTLAAEAAESLGDSWLALEVDWNRAWNEYQRALKYWAASTDLDRARARYLGIVWKATGPPGTQDWSRRVPLDVLVNSLEIASTAEERARAHFFLGRAYSMAGDPFSRRRAGREYQAALDSRGDAIISEVALFELAEWKLQAGVATWRSGGGLSLGPDYEAALALFQRFVAAYPPGTSAFTERAAGRIAEITSPTLTVRASEQFLPGVRPTALAEWRNVGELQLTLARVNLATAFQPTASTDPASWLDAVRVTPGDTVRTWREAEIPGQRHAPRSKVLELEAIAEPGAYVLEARGGELSARALILVTEGAVILQAFGDEVVTFVCQARTGERMAGASVTAWRARAEEDRWVWTSVQGTAGSDGLARLALPPAGNESWAGHVMLFGQAGPQPVVAETHVFARERREGGWRVQVFADRAAFRPTETVRWKLLARERMPEGAYRTPAGELLRFTVTDPQGSEVHQGEVRLTEFGGAWGELIPGTDWPLGEYTIAFRRGNDYVGEATLFRLEEYRLPEFKAVASAGSPGEDAVRLGDEFLARVEATYYFGGPVVDAKVTFEVREEPYVRLLPWEARGRGAALTRPFAGGEARVVRNETVRTDPSGVATLRVATPLDGRGDLRYTILARVVDASGREVTSETSLIVGRQGYFVDLTPARRVAQPGDRVAVSFKARDGNERPVATAGVLTFSRQRWSEVWRDPRGREVTGEELDRLRRGIFPPPGESGWKLVREEYVREEVARVDAATAASGQGRYVFRPMQPGYYEVAWTSPDGDGPPVTATANLWVSTEAGGVLGYRSGGVEIIVDPAAARRGGRVPVLITTDTTNRDVLFTLHSGGGLFRAEILRVEGTARLVELEADPRFVPNVHVTAAAVRGLEFFAATEEISFPPGQQTLALTLTPSAGTFAPGADASFRLEARDAAGRPIRGEFALSVSDAAVAAIQEDYAQDPVDFFFGERWGDPVSLTSSISLLPFPRDPTESAAAASVRRLEMSGFGAPAELAAQSIAAPAGRAMDKSVAAATVVLEEEVAAVAVRTDFRTTAFWEPGIVTNEDGVATVKFRLPESLTTWRAVARGASAGNEFGETSAEVVTTKPLIARLQTPRFLVAGDRADLAGIFTNRTDAELNVRTELAIEGLGGTPKPQTVRVGAGGDGRVTWGVEAREVGTARMTLRAAAGTHSDGVAQQIPIFENGIDKAVFAAGKVADEAATWTVNIPAERRPGSESLVVTATPSLAAAALDALPYLIRYPYGCVEQTMSRFLPAAVTARTLQSLGLNRAAVARRIFGGIEAEHLAKTHPRFDDAAGLEELDTAIARGLARLVELQRPDGSWGWWKGDEPDAFMTAYVVWGLRIAQESGVAVRSDLLDRAAGWLRANLVNAVDDPNLQAWQLHALSANRPTRSPAPEERAALDNLWSRRDQLTSYGRALFALSAHHLGDRDKAATLARNLRDGVTRDDQPGVSGAVGVGQPGAGSVGTVHWGSPGMFLRWQDGGVEATAFALQALLAIEPSSDLIEPAMNWLVKNRRGAQWSNTRDTAITVLALNRYLAATKELGRPVSFQVLVNGRPAGEARGVTALEGVSRFPVDRTLLRDGENAIEVRRTEGDGPIYVTTEARFFTREQPIPAAGNEVFVRRDYARYAPARTLLDGYRFDRIPWQPDQPATPDERIEVTLTVEAKNDLEYLIVEDLKPAGLEAVELRSGAFVEARDSGDRRVSVYAELRDRKVALFLRKLPQGVWTIKYDLRTETPGDFSALPPLAQAMYAPEIRGNGESRRVTIAPR